MIKQCMYRIYEKVASKINLKFCLWIGFSLLISIILSIVTAEVLKPINSVNVEHIDYEKDRYDTEEDILKFIDELYSTTENKEKYITDNIKDFEGNVYITNKNGQVKYKNENDGYAKISGINIDEFKTLSKNCNKDEFKIIYPLTIDAEVNYFIMIKDLNGISIYTYEISYIIGVIVGVVLFIFLIYYGMRRKIKYLEYISQSIEEISKGNLNYVINIEGRDELSAVAEKINMMEDNILNMIEKGRENDKIQNELITNLSHDLKTPLTVILGYLDIIRTDAYKNEEDKKIYINAAYEKAVILQSMVLKLFEMVKLGSQDIKLNVTKVNVTKLLHQIVTDNIVEAESRQLKIDFNGDEKIYLNIDLDKICRVFNNLMSNAIKYADVNTNINVSIEQDAAGALIKFENKCSKFNKDDINNIFTRFYRGDKARNSSVEGSGIGLSIVKRIIELHNSTIWAEYNNNQICFWIRLRG